MFATDKYLELLKQYPPRPIHNEEDLDMIYEYEENQEPIPDIYGIELLKFILEERNLQKQDLLSIFG